MSPGAPSPTLDRPDRKIGHSLAAVSVLVFAQMLPATMVAPAIRPLFAAQHGGLEGAMHAFMALNMLGGAVAAPILGSLADRHRRAYRLAAILAAADALLLFAVALPLPVSIVLGLRTIEGACHVGAATVLMAAAASWAKARGHGKAMGAAGTALMLAVALGSALGGLILRIDPRAPFWVGSLLLVSVAVALRALDHPFDDRGPTAARQGGLSFVREHRTLVLPVTSAFIGRFTVGCFVVTFSLFAHRVHHLSDTAVGALFTLLTFPFALGVYPASRVGDRMPRAALLAAGGILHAASILALVRAPGGALAPLMVCMGLGCAMVFAATLCYAASAVPADKRGRAMSLVNGAGCLGMLLGPATAGIISTVVARTATPADGYRAVFTLAAASILAWLVAITSTLVSRLRSELRADVARRAGG